MTHSQAFRPSVVTLESRWLPSASIYSIPLLNAEQASYVTQAQQADNPVVFLGDSITYNWGTATRLSPGTSVFSKDFAPLGAANFGIYGDTTSDVIARIQDGDLDGKPQVAVVMIGVNNLIQGQTPLQAATGVAQVVQTIEATSPRTTILLLGVLPSDQTGLNPKIQKLDTLISVLGNHPGVVYENPGTQLIGTNGEAQANLLMDGLHPDQAGYTLIANSIDGTVVKLLQQANYIANNPAPPHPSTQTQTPSVVHQESIVSTPAASDVDVTIPLTSTSDDSSDLISTSSTTKPKTAATELINVATG